MAKELGEAPPYPRRVEPTEATPFPISKTSHAAAEAKKKKKLGQTMFSTSHQ